MNQIIGIVIVALAILVQLAACYESRKIVYIHILDIIAKLILNPPSLLFTHVRQVSSLVEVVFN